MFIVTLPRHSQMCPLCVERYSDHKVRGQELTSLMAVLRAGGLFGAATLGAAGFLAAAAGFLAAAGFATTGSIISAKGRSGGVRGSPEALWNGDGRILRTLPCTKSASKCYAPCFRCKATASKA